MSFIKSLFKGFLILVFLPFYWLYAIIWFILFRGKLNGYPRVKKDATAKHIILAVISIFTFSVFASELSDTSTQEANKDIVLRDTYMESVESLEDETELAQEDIYSSLIDDTAKQATAETAGYKSSINYNTDYELLPEETSDYETSASISPYYRPPVDEDSDSITPASPVGSQSATNNSSGEEYNFNKYYNPEQQNTTMSWILNTYTQKIHKTGIESCEYVNKIAPENYSTSNESLDTLKAQGYDPCGHCFK